MAFYLITMAPAPAAIWIGDPDPDATIEPYPVEASANIFHIKSRKPVMLVVVDAEPQPDAQLVAYAIEIKGPTSFSIGDPDPDNPMPPSGVWLPETAPGYFLLPCARPFQLNISQAVEQPAPEPEPPPPPPPPPPPEPEPPPASKPVLSDLTSVLWNLWFSPNMPPQVQWSAGYPLPPVNGLHYVTYPVGNLAPSIYGAIRCRIEVTGEDIVQAVDPNEGPPCKALLFFGTSDTTWAHKRFWAGGFPLPLRPGIHEVTVPLDPQHWTTVDGSRDDAAWSAMANGSCHVGWTCSGRFFGGHGVYSPGSRTGIFMRAYQVLAR